MKIQLIFLTLILLTACQNPPTAPINNAKNSEAVSAVNNTADSPYTITNEEIIAPESTPKSKEELLNINYYSPDSNWSKTFERLDVYIGNKEPQDAFKKAEYYMNNAVLDDEFTFDDNLAFIYYNDLLNQEYVVDLINNNSENKTTVDNWKFNLEFLEYNYQLIHKAPNIDMNIIDLYMEDYRELLLTEDLPDHKPLS